MQLEMNEIPIEIKRKKIKNMYIRISPESGTVKVSVPESISNSRIQKFLLERQKWIEENYKKIREKRKEYHPEYADGGQIRLWGETYPLRFKDNGWKKGIVQGEESISLYGYGEAGQEEIEKVFLKWYREKLKKAVPAFIKKWEEPMNVQVKEWRIKNMKTRWGTCNIIDRRIWINASLAKYPPYCLEYIVIHEMAHLLERSHNERFWRIVGQFCPEWKVIRDELNRK